MSETKDGESAQELNRVHAAIVQRLLRIAWMSGVDINKDDARGSMLGLIIHMFGAEGPALTHAKKLQRQLQDAFPSSIRRKKRKVKAYAVVTPDFRLNMLASACVEQPMATFPAAIAFCLLLREGEVITDAFANVAQMTWGQTKAETQLRAKLSAEGRKRKAAANMAKAMMNRLHEYKDMIRASKAKEESDLIEAQCNAVLMQCVDAAVHASEMASAKKAHEAELKRVRDECDVRVGNAHRTLLAWQERKENVDVMKMRSSTDFQKISSLQRRLDRMTEENARLTMKLNGIRGIVQF